MRSLSFLFALWLSCSVAADSERPKLFLETDAALLSMDLAGGSFDRFELKARPVNPLTWDSWSSAAESDANLALAPRSMGHFLCLDRWGAPSKAEQAYGMPFHGEASQVSWRIESQRTDGGDGASAKTTAILPLAGLTVAREIELAEDAPFFRVTEKVTNTRHLGRVYNIVQHPTIGPPFLDESVLVDSNGTRGFMQDRPLPDPESEEVAWPKAKRLDGTEVDMRRLADDPEPRVVSYVIESELGWVTATNPKMGLMIGYVWPSSEYPWLNLWRHVVEGRPHARGLEFGTTGLHRPEADLVEKGEIYGERLFRYIDAGETQSYEYACFLMELPEAFEGVASIDWKDDQLLIQEAGGEGRMLEIAVANVFEHLDK